MKAFKIGRTPEDYGHKDLTDEQKKVLVKDVRTTWVEKSLPGLMKIFSERVTTNKGFLAGENCTIADMQAYPRL